MNIAMASYSQDIINIGGKFLTIFLLAVLTISLLLIDTKYNKIMSDNFEIYIYPLLISFIAIIIYGIMLLM